MVLNVQYIWRDAASTHLCYMIEDEVIHCLTSHCLTSQLVAQGIHLLRESDVDKSPHSHLNTVLLRF